MTPKKSENENYSDEETERRATDALRRALMTPYKPQQEMVGKSGRPTPPRRRVKTAPKKR